MGLRCVTEGFVYSEGAFWHGHAAKARRDCTYRFADYKEHVIDLIARVVGVSVETVEITEAMKTARR